MILLAMVPGAAYVSIINDVTDREDDRAAGKPNRMAGKSRRTVALLILLTTGFGVAFSWLWRRDALLLPCYLAAWLAFSLYSLPPFRFKARGILGVLCDASGAHLFPTLVAAILTFRAADRPVDPRWLAAVGAWALAYGLRGILWHQLTDVEADRDAGVRTFAQRHPPHVAARLGTYAAFPCELFALAAMLWLLRSPWPVVALAVYALLTVRRMQVWRKRAVVVAPKENFFILLGEYYEVLLPLALLLAAGLRRPWDFTVLAAHLLVFPNRARHVASNIAHLAWRRSHKR